MLARVKGHSFAGKGDWAYVGQGHSLHVWALEADVDSEASHLKAVDVEVESALDLVAVVDGELDFPKDPGP